MAPERQDDISIAIEGAAVSHPTKAKVHEALRRVLEEQLAQEAETLGHAPGRAAIL